ncbi:unnamed protein product [Rotaria sordida]|uniref:Uncharacterized protein n=1 Tax=Rotaria sordida TaxID=392033 RepID=A0A818T955_9BILA|nr:unnamed protein product [Rotaria sordida]
MMFIRYLMNFYDLQIFSRQILPLVELRTWTTVFQQIVQMILGEWHRGNAEDFKTDFYIPSLNRHPTELTPTLSSISYIWYLVFIWQAAWIIYSIIGIFRRTSSGTYFYQHPCAMNKWCYFYTVFGLILFTPQLAAAARNKYGIGISIFRYVGTLCELIIILVVVHVSLWENLKGKKTDNYLYCLSFVDVWLTRLLYHNGLALWASVLFYESCLSIIIGLIYSDLVSPPTASIIGCFLLLFGFITLSILENVAFYNSLAFTLSPWLTFLWLLGGIVFRSHDESSSSVFVIWIFSYSIQMIMIKSSVLSYNYNYQLNHLFILCFEYELMILFPVMNEVLHKNYRVIFWKVSKIS